MEQSDLGPHCLPVYKTRFEKPARIFSRRHKQTTFSDAVFLGALRVKISLQQQIHVNGNIFGNKCCRCNEGSLYYRSKVDTISVVSKQNCIDFIEE